jgi:hypothetical protein
MPRLVSVVICSAILCALSPALLSGQSTGCTAEDSRAQLLPSDPAYRDAMYFGRTLTERGFAVRCILSSKVQNFFEGQEGAAFYRTAHGDFDVVFLPKTKTFAALEIIEHRKKNRYIYSFRGTPHSSTRMDGPRINYFVKHGNALVFAWGNKQLAASLDVTLNQLEKLVAGTEPNTCLWLDRPCANVEVVFVPCAAAILPEPTFRFGGDVGRASLIT